MKIAFMNRFALPYVARTALRNVTIAFSLALMPAAVAAETQTLVALGDSLTQGYGLPEGDGLVPQLQAWLTAQGEDVTVINAGVSGDTTAGGRSRLDWSLTPETDALMVILGGNDLLRGLPPAEARANLDAILTGATARGLPVLLVPMQATTNYGAAYKTQFDGMYADLATEHGAQLGQPFFAALGAATPAAMAAFMQSDGIHPNREGVARIVEALGPQVRDLLATARR
jgi:acyl-CoA thioesterase I